MVRAYADALVTGCELWFLVAVAVGALLLLRDERRLRATRKRRED